MGLCMKNDIQNFNMQPQYGIKLCSLKPGNLAPKGWLTFHTIIFVSVCTLTYCNTATVSEYIYICEFLYLKIRELLNTANVELCKRVCAVSKEQKSKILVISKCNYNSLLAHKSPLQLYISCD
jgi:hypothetical protein